MNRDQNFAGGIRPFDWDMGTIKIQENEELSISRCDFPRDYRALKPGIQGSDVRKRE